jgi:IS30 family transposase
MKTGVLNKAEKTEIIDALKQKKSVADIAKVLDRAEKTVQKYINEVKALFDTEEKADKVESEEISENVIKRAINQLKQYNLSKPSINAKINRITKNMTPEQLKAVTSEFLITECMKLFSVNDIMINKTGNGNEGVSIMTEGASERGDESRKNAKPVKNPNVYNIF